MPDLTELIARIRDLGDDAAQQVRDATEGAIDAVRIYVDAPAGSHTYTPQSPDLARIGADVLAGSEELRDRVATIVENVIASCGGNTQDELNALRFVAAVDSLAALFSRAKAAGGV